MSRNCLPPSLIHIVYTAHSRGSLFLSPYHSCLEEKEPNLEQLLGVLSLCHKYCVTAIEQKARVVANALVSSSPLARSHLNDRITSFRVVEISNLTGCEDLLKSAWNVAMQEFGEGRRSIPEMLNFTESLKREDLLGEVYYETMLKGHGTWNAKDIGLADHQLRALWVGTVRCMEASEAHFRLWRQSRPPFDREFDEYSELGWQAALEKCDERNCPSFDVLGRLQVAIELFEAERGQYGRYPSDLSPANKGVQELLASQKASIWELFQEVE